MVELVSQKLDSINIYHSVAKLGYKAIQVDEFNVSRGKVSNMVWIKKSYPELMFQKAPTERNSFKLLFKIKAFKEFS